MKTVIKTAATAVPEVVPESRVHGIPSVSIVVPTFKRLPLLRRAIDSIYTQTITDWELIITDDEVPSGETWAFVSDLSFRDRRVCVSQNTGPRGQCGNVNNGLRLARAPWIKILHDDDVLRPNCLQSLLDAVGEDHSVALVTCLAAHYHNNQLVKVESRRNRPHISKLPSDLVLLSM
jgi:glycosyltransferase involved in cell wall biosynthesis